MRIRVVPSEHEEWHQWFAWHPVLALDSQFAGYWVWLERVWRRWDGPCDPMWTHMVDKPKSLEEELAR